MPDLAIAPDRAYNVCVGAIWRGLGAMKAFLAGCVAAIVIAVAAGFIMNSLDHSAGTTYSTDNVRL